MNWTIGQRELETHRLPLRRELEIAIDVEKQISKVTPSLSGKAAHLIQEYSEQLRIIDSITMDSQLVFEAVAS